MIDRHDSRTRGQVAWAGVFALLMIATIATAGDVRFLSPSTVVEAGASRVIAFEVARPADEDRTFSASVGEGAPIEMLMPPTVLAGKSVGYVRIRGQQAGRTALVIDGARLGINVVPPPVGGIDGVPVITGPAPGAVAWGTIAVGVEVRVQPDEPLVDVRVELDDGTVLAPDGETGRRHQPYRQLLFTVELADRLEGPLELVPFVVDGPRGRPVRIEVVHPVRDSLLAAEAEADHHADRPQRFADARRSVGRDPDASGGAYFVNASSNPAICFPVDVATPGRYQVAVVAGGTWAQGVLPTVGVVVDGAPQVVTNGRLLASGWHRLLVGVPFELDAGRHVITPYFANDFFVPRAVDRNLHLDRIEVLRVDGGDAPGAGGGMGGMAAMAPMAGMMGGGGGAGGDDHLGLETPALRIATVRPLDGATLPGTTEIEGRAWWTGVQQRPAPLVTLMINDRAVDAQRSGAPRFWVPSSAFRSGANRVQLVATMPDGSRAATPVQTMHWPALAAADRPATAAPHRRYSIHEERWTYPPNASLATKHNPKERRALAFTSNGEATLELPADLEGGYAVYLEALGEHFQGAPQVAVALRTPDGEEREVGRINAPTWFDTRRVGEIDLPAGAKTLVVAFDNDRYEAGRGDRNVFLQSVILSATPREADDVAPFVELQWPREGTIVGLADAVVADVSDNVSIASAELILDGMQTGLVVPLNLRPGPIVLPLLLRGADPGEHTVAVRVSDVAGNSSTSRAATVVLREGGDPTEYERAVHLLDRLAFGPDPGELAALLVQGEDGWLSARLGAPLETPGELAACASHLPYFLTRNEYDVSQRVVAHALLTPNPVRARFVLWVQNHFSTWIRKTNGDRKWHEHVAFAREGAARFDRLLLTSAESPAMLAYLDQETSFAGRLNENYAREIMELHTLGVDGGYDQADVTSLARLLTGWTTAVEGDGTSGGQQAIVYSHRYDARLNDGREIEVLGLRFPAAGPADRYDRASLALEMLAAHPSTARFVARSLAEHYVALPAPPDLIEALAAVYHETGGDMSAMLVAMVRHPDFDRHVADRIAAPLDYGLRLCRVSGNVNPWRLRNFLQSSGTGLFDRATPDGYPDEDTAYADSNAMVQRWRLARDAVWTLAALVPNPWRYRNDIAEHEWAQLVTDVLAVRMTGRVLGTQSNEAALALIEATTGSRDERVRVLAPFIAQLPEANLR